MILLDVKISFFPAETQVISEIYLTKLRTAFTKDRKFGSLEVKNGTAEGKLTKMLYFTPNIKTPRGLPKAFP